MQATLYKGVYVGPTLEGVIRQGDVTDICRVDLEARVTDHNGQPVQLTTWEVRQRGAQVDDDWWQIDRLDVVIPGHEQPAISELRAILGA